MASSTLPLGGVLLALALAAPASTLNAAPSRADVSALAAASAQAGSPLRVIHGARGTVTYLGGELSGPRPVSVSPERFARDFITRNAGLWGLKAPERELVVVDVSVDAAGGTHVAFEQRHRGVKVYGSQLVVHAFPDGRIQAVGAHVIPGLSSDPRRVMDVSTAMDVVRDVLGPELLQLGEPTLYVRARSAASDLLVYEVPAWLTGGGLPMQAHVLWVDATTGEPLWSENPEREGQVQGTGQTVFGQTVPLNVWEGKDFRLKVSPLLRPYVQQAKKGAYNAVDQTTTDLGWIYTFDANETYMMNVDYVFSNDSSFDGTDTGQAPGVSAHDYFRKTLDFYHQVWGRKGIDDKGLPVSAMVQISDPVADYPLEINAGWLGYGFNFMIFGTGGEWPQGSGVMWRPFSCCLDIIGHELNHGVNEFTVNLGYEHESGALNEHLADVFGVATQAHYEGLDWYVAEKVFEDPVYPYDAVRSFEDPPLYNQPDRMSTFRAEPLTYDAGGVHFNSGIGNKAFFLAVEGGTFNGVAVTPLATTPEAALLIAQNIWYDVEKSKRINHDSQYLEMRNATLDAAALLYPGMETRLARAWDAVEVTTSSYPNPSVDRAEPNDYDEIATPLIEGSTLTGYLWNRADSDMYAITGQGPVTIKVSGLPGKAQATLYKVGLFNEMFDQAVSNNPDAQDEVISFELENGTTYFLEVLVDEDGQGSKTSPYTVSVLSN